MIGINNVSINGTSPDSTDVEKPSPSIKISSISKSGVPALVINNVSNQVSLTRVKGKLKNEILSFSPYDTTISAYSLIAVPLTTMVTTGL